MAKPGWRWIKVDVALPRHPRYDSMTWAAKATLIEMWLHCQEDMTDGHVRPAVWNRTGTAAARQQLLDYGWACPNGDGYLMSNYLEHQQSRQDIENNSDRKRKAGQLGGIARWRRA